MYNIDGLSITHESRICSVKGLHSGMSGLTSWKPFIRINICILSKEC